jgi:hypothetical protein
MDSTQIKPEIRLCKKAEIRRGAEQTAAQLQIREKVRKGPGVKRHCQKQWELRHLLAPINQGAEEHGVTVVLGELDGNDLRGT